MRILSSPIVLVLIKLLYHIAQPAVKPHGSAFLPGLSKEEAVARRIIHYISFCKPLTFKLKNDITKM